MWSGILLALAVYALFGLVPAVANTVVTDWELARNFERI